MNEDKISIAKEKIFDAVRKCRLGKVSEEVALTLSSANLLRGVMHIGPAQKLRIVFARALKGRAADAEEHIKAHLPPQASLRFATTFRVDFIISGQLPETWADDQLAKRSDLFEDVYEAEVIAVRRYRWGIPTKTSPLRSQAKLGPSADDVLRFLSEPKQETRLVYDSSRLPSLSCLAVITTESTNLAQIWEDFDDEDQQPVRDILRNVGHKVNMDAAIMDRDAIQHVGGYAFCEFDSIDNWEEGPSFMPAMNRAYLWRRRIVQKKGIEQVRLIPCAVMNESIDYYDEVQESKDRLALFGSTVALPIGCTQTETNENKIPFPIWNVAICGGSGSGKSVIAYLLASALLTEQEYDVVYVNYKNSDETKTLDQQPRKEALEFASIIEHVAKEGINLVSPEAMETTMSGQEKAGAYYTECARDVRVAGILDSILNAHLKKSKKSKRGTFIFFDELLNQKARTEDLKCIEKAINQLRTSNIYLGIIHQNLASFWEDDSASVFAEQSTVILASKLLGKDEKAYLTLLGRAGKRPPPVSQVDFKEIKGYQIGQFVFLPTQGGNSEHPVRGRIPHYSFLKKLGAIPEDWKWDTKTKVTPS